jgi:hypothetical protein
LGLNSLGKKYQRRPNARNRSERLEMRRLRGLQAWNRRVAKLRAMNRTSRGGERIYVVRRADAIVLQSQLESLARALAGCFGDLPPQAQSKVMELETHLVAIRRQFV